jgi:GTP-binding protein
MKKKLPVVVIVGRPNVGKSTLFNRIIRQRVAVVEDEPGITRDRLYAETEWQNKRFTVVDTGGILFNDDDPLVEQIRVQAQIALEEADVVIFLTDATSGNHPDDQLLANSLRGFKKPILVVVNKADNPQREMVAGEFYELGLGEVFAISSLHGRNVADMLDRITDLLPDSDELGEKKEEIRLAIIGRPNVGKSSLLNAFTGERRAIVSNIPGTTRDAIDTVIQYRGETFRLIDTAGLRRRGKIQGSVEYYMAHRATAAIERCDCALVVIDGSEGLTDGDKRVAKMSHDNGKALVFAVNKWDLQEPPDGQPRQKSPLKKDFKRILSDQVPEVNYAVACFTSAKESAGLEPVLDAVLQAMSNYNFRISTGQLNRLIADATFAKPLTRKGRALKIYYATQAKTAPPTFILFCNDPELLHFSYLRYLENTLRKNFPLPGTPIRILVRSSHEKKS